MRLATSCVIALIIALFPIGYAASEHRHVPTEFEIHPPEMRCFPPRDMLDWSEHDDPPGLCPDFHHLDV
jgi:hypothetical protein